MTINSLRADLTGDKMVSIGDIIARGSTPVLALCQSLIAAGMDPDQALEVYRGTTLALTVRSIGAGAHLTVKSAGNGAPVFTAEKGAAASPMRSREVPATQHEARP